jgi:hypothetical protein
MAIDKVEKGNNIDLYKSMDIGVYHTWVVVVCMDYGVFWYRLIHLPCETYQVVLDEWYESRGIR